MNVITVSREYGSGGYEVARRLSEDLGWELLDRELLHQAAAVEHLQVSGGHAVARLWQRVAKCNQLLRIERQLGARGVYPGRRAFRSPVNPPGPAAGARA